MKKIHQFSSFYFAVMLVIACLLPASSQAQNDTVTYRIGLLLPFAAENTAERLDAFNGAKDVYSANRIHLLDETVYAMDFYEGLTQSLRETKDLHIILTTYDTENSDSITKILLDSSDLKKQDIIIGSVSTPESRLIADFCRKNKIINVQPFTPSKSLGSDNPFHLKLAPTIDAHTDALFNSVVDSFAGANIIIYTPESENSLGVARRLDSLFKDYNSKSPVKFTVALLNAKDMLLNGKKTTATEQLKPGIPNIVFLTSFEESFVNGNLRVLNNERTKYHIIVYGMPNWLNGDILRLDYLNDYNTHISDGFMVDTAKVTTKAFNLLYKTDYSHEPTRYSYLGYDVMGFISDALKTFGKNFLDGVCSRRYPGLAYKFDVSKNKKGEKLNYYENRHLNVFKIKDYQLVKTW